MNQYPQTSFASFITNVPTNPLVGSEFVPLVVANQYTEKITLANLTAYIFLQSATAIASLPVASTPLAGTEFLEVIQGGIAKVTTVSSVTENNANIVIKKVYLNLAADIAVTPLFTPTVGGKLYRMSAYAMTTVIDAGAGSLTFTVGNQDDVAVRANPFAFIALTILTFHGNSFVIESVAGQPITFSFTGGAPYGTARYNLYVDLEALN